MYRNWTKVAYHNFLVKNYIQAVKPLLQKAPKSYKKDLLEKIKAYYMLVNQDKKIFTFYQKIKYMELNQLMQNAFSVTNEAGYKVVKIFGTQIKIKKLKH